MAVAMTYAVERSGGVTMRAAMEGLSEAAARDIVEAFRDESSKTLASNRAAAVGVLELGSSSTCNAGVINASGERKAHGTPRSCFGAHRIGAAAVVASFHQRRT
ncbi:hypothetical protein GUJ93_ZPchr0004g39008 [Zizania palustris]|uniref:Uncharacterized protein n=1 Tax=Zizania palustris TaxID=103762 RepID=A0A8J5S0Q9_ZIZPA|nr:hypothetical protein GUJ93_ZPchr0004g39008 [Zizania palustris]